MVWKPKKGPLSKSNLTVRCRTASVSVKHQSVEAAVAEDRSESVKLQRAAVAGEEALKVLEWPADAAKLV